jgi:hypothetical protein
LQWTANLTGLGFVLPPPIGLLFILAKPQLGAAVAVFWLVQVWRRRGFAAVLRMFLPVAAAYLLSFALFGFWPGKWFQTGESPIHIYNQSLWPWGIPIGLALLAASIGRGEIKFAIAASPFLAPYVQIYSYAIVWLGLVSLVPQDWGPTNFLNGFFTRIPGLRKA